MQNKSVYFLVIGAGAIGLNLAMQLKNTFSDSRVCVLEKEPQPGLHASGRNSGVLHAGLAGWHQVMMIPARLRCC